MNTLGNTISSFVDEQPLLATVVAILFVGVLVISEERLRRMWSKKETRQREGVYLGPTRTNILLRPVISLTAGQFVGWTLFVLAALLGSSLFPWWAATILGLLLTLWFAQNDSEPIKVPKTHVAILTFLGKRLPIYLEEGDHYWYGGMIGFSYSSQPLNKPATEGEKVGFVFMGPRVLEIWNRQDEGDKGFVLSNVARNSSEVKTKLTITIFTINPRRYANSTDPVLDTAERARSGLRTIVAFFTDTDNPAMKSVYNDLLGGQQVVTAMIKEPVSVHPRGSIIQTFNGTLLFRIIARESDEDLEEAKKVLLKQMGDTADEEMLEQAKDRHGNVLFQAFKVEDHMAPVMERVGARFDHASVSDVTLSDEVGKQANIASGETLQRVAQIQSAKAIRDARAIMKEGLNEPGGEFATAAALARDGHATLVHVSGDGDRLSKAAVAAAKSIGGR